MERYFIDFRDQGGLIRDEEGAEFAHLEEALNEAKASARDVVKQYIDGSMPLDDICVEIRDQTGTTVAVLTVEEMLKHTVHPNFTSSCEAVPGSGRR